MSFDCYRVARANGERSSGRTKSSAPWLRVVDEEHFIALAAILQMNGYSAKCYTCPLEALTAARLKAPDAHI